jgi:hypothetical protein
MGAMERLLPYYWWPGARSRGGRGLAKPVVLKEVSPLAVVLRTRSNVVMNAAKAATVTSIANNKITVPSGFGSVGMSNSTQRAWQRSSLATKLRMRTYQLSLRELRPSALQTST